MNRLPYATWKVGAEEYKLKFSAVAVVEAENKLGKGLFRSMEEIDKVSVQVTLLWAALQKFNHGTSRNTVYDLYDEYMDNSGDLEKLLDVIMETLEISGFMTGKQEKDKAAKNTQPKA